jgi:rod shape-determining protein MreD
LSGGLLGANGFCKTLVAYIVSEIARRVYLDNLLLRIPVIAGACLLDDFVYYGMHRLLGQHPNAPLVETIAYNLLGTAIVGTMTFLLLESFFSEKAASKKRDFFGSRRQTRRRNPIRLGRRG